MTANARNGTLDRLGGGATAVARLCLIVGFGSVFLVAIAAGVPDSAKDAVYWVQRAVVSAAILVLLWLFVRNPRPSRHPEGLTLTLLLSFCLAVAALATGFWPGFFAGLLTPLLTAGSWLVERIRR
ncbi:MULTISPECIES: hypothetical protein [unclassified Streptomyces]|uniref:hypothetical protein n=1 Tax=unclassified Streptomyces TaxID=2593676 RepID=UPI001371B47F|nr:MULTISPECIES: hypothetical protein [unclassified Streptomyces]NEA04487.1 hypothetical protein [Streptomyces sp. SID10116]MYY85160.1 hypothetical protein [Streptomyces sp. SID335]MYZ15183.1 hypothetical protein [Streptomyces sp. SID337]NDZ84828.1 hypothetical protein [Streptomyces sp. SID10115]NEB45940.1 hypothetical protein [Streptomyces sp. SID339]